MATCKRHGFKRMSGRTKSLNPHVRSRYRQFRKSSMEAFSIRTAYNIALTIPMSRRVFARDDNGCKINRACRVSPASMRSHSALNDLAGARLPSKRLSHNMRIEPFARASGSVRTTPFGQHEVAHARFPGITTAELPDRRLQSPVTASFYSNPGKVLGIRGCFF
jgi:hypothetical protein